MATVRSPRGFSKMPRATSVVRGITDSQRVGAGDARAADEGTGDTRFGVLLQGIVHETGEVDIWVVLQGKVDVADGSSRLLQQLLCSREFATMYGTNGVRRIANDSSGQ